MPELMGSAIAVLRGKRFAGGWLLYVGGVLVLAGLANVLHLTGKPFAPGAAVAGRGIGGLMLAPCLGLTLQTVEVFSTGLAWKRYGRTRFLPFASIRNVSMKRCLGNIESYDEVSLTMADGTTYLISHLEAGADLVRHINTYGARHE